MNDVLVAKIASIQRCVKRAREEYYRDPEGFDADFTRQDAALLNVLRACEQAIDLANHAIKSHKLGVPTSTGESFDLLQRGGVIDAALAGSLKKMVHFRNILVHQYQRLEMAAVREAITVGLDDLVRLGDDVLAFEAGR
ncbi:MAG: DUF86 domain-containing protein [Chloroflexi bacterium]|nr:DUF86 domain-containing protein [Chloroflexota bacterium]